MHVDMDAFFAALEQLANPALRGKPVIVSGDPGSRSVVSSASYEARKFGVKSAMPLQQALRLCPEAHIAHTSFGLYVDAARKLRATLLTFTPLVQVASIDEAYLEFDPPLQEPVAQGLAIKQAVLENVGCTCSVGIGPNKLIAKLASDADKPDGIVYVPSRAVQAFMDKLPVRAIPGIGPRGAESLERLRIRTVFELRQLSEDDLETIFGEAWGRALWHKARGHDDSPVHTQDEAPLPKSMSADRTLRRDTWDRKVIEYYLLDLSEELASRLRHEKLVAQTVGITLKLSDLEVRQKHRTVDGFLFDAYDIYQLARVLASQIRLTDRPVRMVGVKVQKLFEAMYQPTLFEDFERKQQLNQAVDDLRERFGEKAIVRARLSRPPGV